MPRLKQRLGNFFRQPFGENPKRSLLRAAGIGLVGAAASLPIFRKISKHERAVGGELGQQWAMGQKEASLDAKRDFRAIAESQRLSGRGITRADYWTIDFPVHELKLLSGLRSDTLNRISAAWEKAVLSAPHASGGSNLGLGTVSSFNPVKLIVRHDMSGEPEIHVQRVPPLRTSLLFAGKYLDMTGPEAAKDMSVIAGRYKIIGRKANSETEKMRVKWKQYDFGAAVQNLRSIASGKKPRAEIILRKEAPPSRRDGASIAVMENYLQKVAQASNANTAASWFGDFMPAFRRELESALRELPADEQARLKEIMTEFGKKKAVNWAR